VEFVLVRLVLLLTALAILVAQLIADAPVIQCFVFARLDRAIHSALRDYWMPAFAGMTG
jgi:hypothetical protein